MAKIPCPCNCGKSFEPERTPNGLWRKYATPACQNRMKQQRWRARQKKNKLKNQRSLQFQPGVQRSERRSKGRAPKAPAEESMFA